MDQGAFTLFLYILMRISGMILFSPFFGRTNVPGMVRAGFILVLSVATASFTGGTAIVPATLIEFGVRLSAELLLGYLLGFVMHLFFMIAQLAGQEIDNQMGMTMSQTYDAGAQVSMSNTSTLFNVMMLLLFVVANGHLTLLRILLTSGEVVAYGAVSLGDAVPQAVTELFISCIVLGVKLALPILAAELMGQVGMGILMKVIPQINVFAINIELKVIIGLVLLLILVTPFSEFLLEAENQMLYQIQQMLTLAG